MTRDDLIKELKNNLGMYVLCNFCQTCKDAGIKADEEYVNRLSDFILFRERRILEEIVTEVTRLPRYMEMQQAVIKVVVAIINRYKDGV